MSCTLHLDNKDRRHFYIHIYVYIIDEETEASGS